MTLRDVKSVAIIGAGPAGAITIDALAQEKAFDNIRVFERRERAGGCWVYDEGEPPSLGDLDALSSRAVDKPVPIPDTLPGVAPRLQAHRFSDTPVYPALEANIDASIMQFSQERIPEIRSQRSIDTHGPDTPFRHHTVISKYIEGLVNRRGYNNLVEFNTTVENVKKNSNPSSPQKRWTLTLRQHHPGREHDFWWQEEFDAVIVATGHYSVPYIPKIPGLKEFAAAHPDRIEHTKGFRDPEKYRGKRVVTIGASVSGADTAFSLVDIAQTPVHAVVRGKYNGYFGDEAFKHPKIQRHPPVSHVTTANAKLTVFFQDGSHVDQVDHLIFGTGYTWTLPFLPQVPVRNNRVPDLYLHIFHEQDPTLAFIGAVAAGFTFKVFEWQAVLVARVLAGRASLPSLVEQKRWAEERVQLRGDGVPFTLISPDFEAYFELLREMAGTPGQGEPGRRLPRFDRRWLDTFQAGHKRRIQMWRRANEAGESDAGMKSKL
ncbi:hypothetical protein FE257_010852 [Aspergillus nanangensis]|uniref:Uncharacterized protein n=1 Tax=Aspergillus nanangensis TaxID=2582783 RepID=A0AAD4CVM2_ASPNN|nr:hypothetical protein FE257_010852 [Aspergillus nanangensis]